MDCNVHDNYKVYQPGDDNEPVSKNMTNKATRGVIEIIIKDKNGNIVEQYFEPNIIKIFAKEMLAHRLPSSEIWDPEANSGAGGWVDDERDPDEEFSARYILIGGAFDTDGSPVQDDPRYYALDTVSGAFVPIRLEPGADFDGGLINAIPISEPDRPLKRVESVTFEPTYQPAGIPLLQDDVRAINNIVALQTTIKLSEYNGFGVSASDFFVVTEVALAGGRKIDSVGLCECDPKALFLEGVSTDNRPLLANASGTDVISIDPSESEVDLIKEGDQIKIVAVGDTVNGESIDQVSPFYLVRSKAAGGRDIQLDRVPVDADNNAITGPIGIYRDTLRIFSHRILKTPIKKSADFEIIIRWRIIMN